jgi:hypothetical protein
MSAGVSVEVSSLPIYLEITFSISNFTVRTV